MSQMAQQERKHYPKKKRLMYQELQDFVHTHMKPQYGLMNHALCAGIRALLKACITDASPRDLTLP